MLREASLVIASVLALACHRPRDPIPTAEPPIERARVEPEEPPAIVPVTAIAVGDSNVCAVLQGGRLRCWGSGETGLNGYWGSEHIGDDETPASAGDLDVGGPVVRVSMTRDVACALLVSGDVRCWGQRWTEGGNRRVDGTWPIELGGPATRVSVGEVGCALLETGDVRCWGYSEYGNLGVPAIYGQVIGDDERVDSISPVDVGGPAIDVAGTCALLESGSIRCWGEWPHPENSCLECDSHWWCCVGDHEPPSVLDELPLGGRAIALAERGGCAIVEGGVVRCWVRGFGDPPQRDEPIVQVSGNCELSQSGVVRCAGYRPVLPGRDMSLDTGDRVVELGHPAIAIATGGSSCALLETGTVRCWGDSDHGELGHANRDIIGDDETPASMGDIDIAGVLEHRRQPQPPRRDLLARLEAAGVTLTEMMQRGADGSPRHHAKVELADRSLESVASVLAEVETLASLDVSGNGLRDTAALEWLTRLEFLDLSQNPVTDLSGLERMKRLQRLDLHLTEVNVDDVIGMRDVRRLRWLDVRETKVYGNEDRATLQHFIPVGEVWSE